MGYEIHEHTADVAVSATGETLEATFEAMAVGLTETHCETPPAPTASFSIHVTAESLEAILFDFLDELIYQRDVRYTLPVQYSISLTELDGEWVLEGTIGGVPLADINAREIKAVTYSEMELLETESGWYAYVVFDV